jgi:hypothetical protein
MMKTMTIEEMLIWAFVNELPKGGGTDGLENSQSAWRGIESSYGAISRFAVLGTTIQTGSGNWDHPNTWIEQGDAHPDALALGEEVANLGRCRFWLPDDWSPLSDWPDTMGLAEASVAKQVARFNFRHQDENGRSLVALVVGTAVLGKRPDWTSVPLETRLVERGGKPAWFVMRQLPDNFGQPCTIEVDGYNAKNGRPMRGAYRKFELSGNPAGDILARLDWQLWVAALRRLDTRMRSKLVEHRLADFDERMTPWQGIEGAGPASAVLAAKKLSPAL